MGAGLYIVSFQCPDPGYFTVRVLLNVLEIAGSPLKLWTNRATGGAHAAAEASRVILERIPTSREMGLAGPPGGPASLRVQCRDTMGQVCEAMFSDVDVSIGPYSMRASLAEDPTRTQLQRTCSRLHGTNVDAILTGIFVFNFSLPPHIGRYESQLLIDGAPISGDPFVCIVNDDSLLARMHDQQRWVERPPGVQDPPDLESDVKFRVQCKTRKRSLGYTQGFVTFTRGMLLRRTAAGELCVIVCYAAVDSILVHGWRTKLKGRMLTLAFHPTSYSSEHSWGLKIAPEEVEPFVQELVRRAFVFGIEPRVNFHTREKFETNPRNLTQPVMGAAAGLHSNTLESVHVAGCAVEAQHLCSTGSKDSSQMLPEQPFLARAGSSGRFDGHIWT